MYNKIIVVFILTLSSLFSFSQNEQDALRYSQTMFSGTARSMSMGGAFGALGGDFSGIATNPAGLAVFRNSELSITPTISYNRTTGTVGKYGFDDFEYDFGLNNIGLVGAFNTGNKSGWISTNIGVGYNRVANFDNNILFKVDEGNSSMMDYLAYDRNTYNSPFYGELAYNAGGVFLGEKRGVFLGEEVYISDFFIDGYGQEQRHSISTNGGMGEFLFAVATNFDNKIYIGASLGIQNLKYNEHKLHEESDLAYSIEYTNSFVFEEDLNAEGTGYNFKIGALIRPVQWMRIGAAVHSPTFFDIEESYSTEMTFNMDDGNSYNDRMVGANNYSLTTPLKALGSLGFVIGKKAIVSMDYEFVDYATTRLRDGGDGYEFLEENEAIQGRYQAASNLRFGAEMRFGPMSIRGGYGIYGNPYSSEEINSDAEYSVYSAGFGINSNDFYFDLAYSFSTYSEEYVMYQYAGTYLGGTIDYNPNQIIATFGFRF